MNGYQFIFFVRLADGRTQEMTFSADSTAEAVRLLQWHLQPDDEIINCYKEVKNWSTHLKK